MREPYPAAEDPDAPRLYAIRRQDHLEDRWAAWFEALTLTRDADGDSLLTGRAVDPAALHGLLQKVRDLAVPLIAVTRVRPGQAGVSAVHPRSGGQRLGPPAEEGGRPVLSV